MHIEVPVWRDAEKDDDVDTGFQVPDANFAQSEASSKAKSVAFATRAGFPQHGVVAGKPEEPWLHKA